MAFRRRQIRAEGIVDGPLQQDQLGVPRQRYADLGYLDLSGDGHQLVEQFPGDQVGPLMYRDDTVQVRYWQVCQDFAGGLIEHRSGCLEIG